MKIIKCVVKNIEEELGDAEKYAKLAIEFKDAYPELSETFINLSKQEVNHANMLHSGIERVIKNLKAEGKEAPAAMQVVYDWEHEKMIDNLSKVKVLQELF